MSAFDSRQGRRVILFPGSARWGLASIVHQRWVSRIKTVQHSPRWAYVKIRAWKTWQFISAHFPHSWGVGTPEVDAEWDSVLESIKK
eukprot:13337344-Alexandrium_andersonii.AAC.1